MKKAISKIKKTIMMKRIHTLLGLFILLTAFQCEDDDFLPTTGVELPTMVSVANDQTVFAQDEFITINTVIPNEVTTTDGEMLSLKEYLDENEGELSYLLLVYKNQEGGDLQSVPISIATADTGVVSYDPSYPSMAISTVYNIDNNTFVSSVRFKVSEAGSYYLGGGHSRNSNKEEILISAPHSSERQLVLFSSIQNAGDNGLYGFIVE